MAPTVTLLDELAKVPSLRALSKELAADPRSEKSAEVWRGQLHQWQKKGISYENAVILADHLPGRPDPLRLVDQDPRERQALQDQLDGILRQQEATERTLSDMVARLLAIEQALRSRKPLR